MTGFTKLKASLNRFWWVNNNDIVWPFLGIVFIFFCVSAPVFQFLVWLVKSERIAAWIVILGWCTIISPSFIHNQVRKWVYNRSDGFRVYYNKKREEAESKG